MAITSLTQRQIDAATFRVEWESDLSEPTFYVYVNGRLVEETRRSYTIIGVTPGEPVRIEVFDNPNTAPEEWFPGRFVLGWDAVAGAESYQIQESDGSTWETQGTVQDTGASYYTWRSRVLPDGLEAVFRVRARSAGGNAGTAREAFGVMVRTPSPPDVSMEWDATAQEVLVT